jgi:photosystem II stability/assembly factor-like uncharacterized protein
LDSVLGTGSFATVYRGTDSHDDSWVAVKVFDRCDEAVGVLLQVESKAMRAVEDPHCVRVLDVVAGPPPGLVTEYVDGATLRAVLERAGRLTGRQALDVVRGAVLGLGAVHRAGLLHGDVKPANILVDRAGASKLIDFGLARPVDGSAGAQLSGSPAYMSPEQAGGGMVDERSDIYALAAVLFEFLTGQHPFPGSDPGEVMRRHVEDPVPDAHAVDPRVPADLARVCRMGLAKNPDDRYQNVPAFLEALEEAAIGSYGAAWAAGTGLGALVGTAVGLGLEPTRPARPRRGRRPSGRVLGAVAGAGVLVAAGSAVALLNTGQHQRPAAARPSSPNPSATRFATGSPTENVIGTATAGFVSPQPISANDYYAASCPSAQVCLATGQSAAGRPLVSVSDDGGVTWTTTYPALPDTPGLLSCSNPTTCVAGYYDTAIHMVRTTDGGRTWTAARTPQVTSIESISCPSATQCLAVGGLTQGGGTAQAIATTDRGVSWHVVAVPGPAESVSCADAGHCWVAGAAGKVWSTDAAGTGWTNVSPPTTFPPPNNPGPFPANTVFPVHGSIGELGFFLQGVAFGTDQDGIAFGGAQCGGENVTQCRSAVWRTNDGGRHWSLWPQADQSRYGDGAYAACVGTACLLVTDTFSGSVLASTANGVDWTQRAAFTQFAGRVTCSSDGGTCIVIGHGGLWVSRR